MRLALDPRARRLLRRVPQKTVYTALELLLLSLLAVQSARLLWTIVTPVGPVGEWKTAASLQPPPRPATGLLAEFDPFFRVQGNAAPAVVTSLNLTLFGIREDVASNRGSAIIATPDGQQRSFVIGEEIVPGVILSQVAFDNVTIMRNGTPEQLFMDQSAPAQTVAPSPSSENRSNMFSSPPPAAPAPPPQAPPPAANALGPDVRFQPRLNGGEVTGVTVDAQGGDGALRAAGLAPGDVILSVNGQRIRSADQARGIAGQLSGAREATVQVERDGRVQSVRVRPNQ